MAAKGLFDHVAATEGAPTKGVNGFDFLVIKDI